MILNYVLSHDSISFNLTLNTGEILDFNYITSNYAFSGNSYSLSPKISIRPTAFSKERYYRYSFDLWINEVNVGILSTDCILPKAEPTAKFKVENAVFYSTPGILFYMERLEAECDIIQAGNPSYIEIPLDFQLRKPLLPRLSQMERHSTLDQYNANPKYRPLRKQVLLDKKANGGTYLFGHGAKSDKGTGKQIAVYCKSKEIADNGHHKLYISRSHKANGFDLGQPVERIEARISGRWLAEKDIKVTLADLVNPEALKTLFIKAVGDVFRFIEVSPKNKPKYDTQRNYKHEITDLFPLDFLEAKTVTFPKKEKSRKASENNKRITHKSLVHQFVEFGTPETAAVLRTYEANTTAPAGTDWAKLRHRFAYDFKGAPTAENSHRITFISSLLSPGNNEGCSTKKNQFNNQ